MLYSPICRWPQESEESAKVSSHSVPCKRFIAWKDFWYVGTLREHIHNPNQLWCEKLYENFYNRMMRRLWCEHSHGDSEALWHRKHQTVATDGKREFVIVRVETCLCHEHRRLATQSSHLPRPTGGAVAGRRYIMILPWSPLVASLLLPIWESTSTARLLCHALKPLPVVSFFGRAR